MHKYLLLLAVTGCGPTYTYLGDADGGVSTTNEILPVAVFAPAVDARDGESHSMVVADFNKDAKLDIFASGEATAGLLGKGDGTFTATNGMLGASTWLAAGDINGDSKTDLVTVGTIGVKTMLSYLGNADGSFQAPTQFDATQPVIVELGDFSGDGLADLAVANRKFSGAGSLAIFVSGQSAQLQETDTSDSPGALLVLDLNGDGKPDVLMAGGDASQSQGWVNTFFGRGDGHMDSGKLYSSLVDGVAGLGTGDFDGDGKLDVVAVTAHGLLLFGHGDGMGGFTFGPSFGGETASAQDAVINIGVGDFNHDQKLDVVILVRPDSGTPYLNVIPGDGKGLFGIPQHLADIGTNLQTGGHPLGIGDFNGDGKPDIAIAHAKVDILLNQSP